MATSTAPSPVASFLASPDFFNVSTSGLELLLRLYTQKASMTLADGDVKRDFALSTAAKEFICSALTTLNRPPATTSSSAGRSRRNKTRTALGTSQPDVSYGMLTSITCSEQVVLQNNRTVEELSWTWYFCSLW